MYTHFVYDSADFRAALAQQLRSWQPDIIHLDSLDLVGYADVLRHRRVVCAHHNVESALLRRRAVRTRNPLRKGYLRLQARWYGSAESRWVPRFDVNVAVSDADRALLLERSPSARVEVAPNGVDVDFFSPGSPTVPSSNGHSIVFLGGLDWFPNRDGLDFFAGEILPRLRREVGQIDVVGIGRCSEADRERYWTKYQVRLTGYVTDVRPYLDSASCTIVPLRVGGGTRLKITTAWAMAVPVVSTPLGAEGLEYKDGSNILIRSRPDEFARGIIEILEDSTLQERLAREGRRTACERYSWDLIGKTMWPWYKQLVRDP